MAESGIDDEASVILRETVAELHSSSLHDNGNRFG
ncbi:hypothetical protein QOU61_04485 [Bradyrhizobium sp. NP1]|nr:hypothetical protein [Bradyrhizobium sp. NP1]WJR79066.1 hypothetical protein QOU61_04485 [Bradyrhizobium sp. NP1]